MISDENLALQNTTPASGSNLSTPTKPVEEPRLLRSFLRASESPQEGDSHILGREGAKAHTALLRRSQPPARLRTVPDLLWTKRGPRHALKPEHFLPVRRRQWSTERVRLEATAKTALDQLASWHFSLVMKEGWGVSLARNANVIFYTSTHRYAPQHFQAKEGRTWREMWNVNFAALPPCLRWLEPAQRRRTATFEAS